MKLVIFLLLILKLLKPSKPCIRNTYFNELLVSGMRYTDITSTLTVNDQEVMRKALLDAAVVIKSRGYPAENHTIFTSDGYILRMHRIPFGKNNTNGGLSKRVPVLLIHGLSLESTQWIHNDDDSLGFILADEGYDVWLGNLRGNRYSNVHMNFPNNKAKFWDFSFEEIAESDLPALIQYILRTTDQEKLLYIGHSLGTTVAFALLAAKPEYNKYFKGIIALGPLATVSYTTSPLINQLLDNYIVIQLGNSALGINTLFQADPVTLNTTLYSCPSSDPYICEFIMGLFGGYNPFLHYKNKLPNFASHNVAGVSLKMLAHFGQIRSGKIMTRYDFGRVRNMMTYGQMTPPAYDLSKITTPIAIFYAANDAEANPIDVVLLKRQLQTVMGTELFPHPMAGKNDFHWAFASKDLIYNKVIKYLHKMENL